MSNSLLQSKHNVLLFIFFIGVIAIDAVTALELGLYPGRVNFDGDVGQYICRNITLSSSIEELAILVQDSWANSSKSTSAIADYTEHSFLHGISMDYNSLYMLNKKALFPVCLRGEQEGFYQGVLVFEPVQSSLQLGVWMLVNVTDDYSVDKYKQEKKKSFVTGAVINAGNKEQFFMALVFMSMTLLTILAVLMRYSQKRKREKSKNRFTN